MEIIQEDEGKKGCFKAVSDGAIAGEMTYVWAGDATFIIDHTEVGPAFAGQGVGKKLLMKAVDFARNRKVTIIPLCPFARSVFEKTKDIRDVLS